MFKSSARPCAPMPLFKCPVQRAEVQRFTYPRTRQSYRAFSRERAARCGERRVRAETAPFYVQPSVTAIEIASR